MDKNKRDEVQNIIDRFDFDKALGYMNLVGWNIPAAIDIRFRAHHMLTEVADESIFHLAVRVDHKLGLIAYKAPDGGLHLFFYIEHKTQVKI